jgi:hypothetical protein
MIGIINLVQIFLNFKIKITLDMEIPFNNTGPSVVKNLWMVLGISSSRVKHNPVAPIDCILLEGNWGRIDYILEQTTQNQD